MLNEERGWIIFNVKSKSEGNKKACAKNTYIALLFLYVLKICLVKWKWKNTLYMCYTIIWMYNEYNLLNM